MDQPRRPRGRARGQSQGPPPNQPGQPRGPPPNQPGQPRGPSPNQSGQPRGPRPNQPGQPRGPSPNQPGQPRGPPPNQPGQPRGPPPNQSGQPRAPRPAPSSRPKAKNMPGKSGAQDAEQITSKLEKLKTGDTPIPIDRSKEDKYYRIERPESSKSTNGKLGGGGKSIELVANYFPITTYTDWSLYQYRVDFNPIQERINIQRGLLSVHKDFLGSYIFDGTMLFSSRKYKSDTVKLTSKRNFDDQMVIISVKFTSVVEKGDHSSIQVFNLLLRKCLANLELKLVGRNYYDEKAKIDIPKYRVQLWPGYDTTIGMFDCGLLLRSEISTKIMREETVLDYLKLCASTRNLTPNWMDKFKMVVIGCVVLTRYNNKTYKIDDVDEDSNTQSTFLMKDGSRKSYIDYYREKYNINLSNQRQPMLVSKKKKSFKIEGENSELVYLVPELCTFTGISNEMRSDRTMMNDLAAYTRVYPNERIVKYDNFINRILTTPKCTELLSQWNLTLSNKLVTLSGRVLEQEKIQVRDTHVLSGDTADWTAQLRDKTMFTRAELTRWAVLGPTTHGREIKQFLMDLTKVAKQLSFNLPPPKIVDFNNYMNTTSYLKELDKVINEMNPSFILCFVQRQRLDNYSCIKRYLCIDRAVPSQVVLIKHTEKINLSVITKIAIQINCKLGGAPWRIIIPAKNTMIVGFDVCHDKQNKNKSFGALVATMNDTHTSYFSCVNAHESGQELSSYFAMCIAKALNKYKFKNNTLPSNIIIYRDGVGDGQLTYVHRTEVAMVKKVCKDFYEETHVGLAFIIVKKRINTRFFFKNTQAKSYQNPPPGTVIDNTVTDPTMYDFYLVSQNVTKGTVTPTHYNVIVDTLSENSKVKITPAILQKLTYKLTHMYYNWSGTVRVPAPCQLAHKLAFLTAQSLQNPANIGLEDYLYFL